jgi:hypothetical protein
MNRPTARRRLLGIAAVGVIAVGTLVSTPNPASASPNNGFSVTCASASPVSEHVRSDMSWSDFQTFEPIYYGDGYRIVQLDISGHGVTVVWQPGTGDQRVRWDMSLSDLVYWDSVYFKAGFRLVDVDRDGGSWAAVWRPGTGAQYWRADIPSWTDFKNQDAVYFAQGLRLVDVIITDNDDITGVWRGDQGSGGQYWQTALATGVDKNNKSQFEEVNDSYQRQGYQLQILKTLPDDSYALGVWRYRGGNFNQLTNMYLTGTGFNLVEPACRANGEHIVSMDVK